LKLWQTRRFRVWTAVLAALAALSLAFALGWRLGAADADKKAHAAVWEAISTLPEPERCALCGNGAGPSYQAPCLVDLSTGEVGELAPAENGQAGTLHFRPCAGLTAVCDTCNNTCQVTIPPEKMGMMAPGHFCRPCRGLLAGAGLEGYLLADLCDIAHIRVYPLRGGETHAIRDYAVCVVQDGSSGALAVAVRG